MEKMTTIIQSWPPNIDAIRKRFPAIHNRVLFAYDGSIYSPSGQDIPDHLIVHEETHFKQQEKVGGAAVWWDKYLTDNKFLIEQEVEAYHNQYEFFCKYYGGDKSAQYKFLLSCARALSSPLYGNSIGVAAALFRIKFGK